MATTFASGTVIPDDWTPAANLNTPIARWGAPSRVTRKGAQVKVTPRGAFGSTRCYHWQAAEYERCAKLGDTPAPVVVVSAPEVIAVAADAVATAPAKPARKGKRPTFTAEEKAEYRDKQRSEAADMLKQAAQDLLTSEGWTAWVKCRAMFHRYSPSNVFLIMVQTGGNATMVASFKKWKEMERNVKKGERSLKVFAPLTRKPNASEIAAGANPERDILVGFKLVPVFDIAQTEGKELPTPVSEPITGDSHMDRIPVLIGMAEALGYKVTFEELHGKCGGYCDPIGKRIVIESDTAPNAQVRILVHEIAHAHGIGYEGYGRKAAEVIVETATYIVCSGMGLDTSGQSIGYVASWGEDDGVESIETFANDIDKVARAIENGLSGKKVRTPAVIHKTPVAA